MSEFRPHVLTAESEQALKPGDTFRECAKDCPEMVVVPAGSFMMGSPPEEKGRNDDELGGHARLSIALGDHGRPRAGWTAAFVLLWIQMVPDDAIVHSPGGQLSGPYPDLKVARL
jgi:hypothetical protein